MAKPYVFKESGVEYARLPVSNFYRDRLSMSVARMRNRILSLGGDFCSGTVVSNEGGRPLLVYHGTTSYFDEGGFFPFSHFGTRQSALDTIRRKIDMVSKKAWLMKSNEDFDIQEIAPHFKPRILRAYLNIQNPLLIEDIGGPNPTAFAAMMMKKKLAPIAFWRAVLKIEKEISYQDAWRLVTRRVKKLGHDGFVYTNDVEDRGKRSYVAIESSQIYVVCEEFPKYSEIVRAESNGAYFSMNVDLQIVAD